MFSKDGLLVLLLLPRVRNYESISTDFFVFSDEFVCSKSLFLTVNVYHYAIIVCISKYYY